MRPIGVVRTWLREETARGLLDATDALSVAPITSRLVPGAAVTLTLTVEADEPLDAASALAETRQRDAGLVAAAGAGSASSFVQRLVLGADAFVVRRDVDGVPERARERHVVRTTA